MTLYVLGVKFTGGLLYSPTGCMSGKGSGTLLVRLYKDNAYVLGHLSQSAHLTNFGGL